MSSFKNLCRKKFHWAPLPPASVVGAFFVSKILCSDPDPTFYSTCQFPPMGFFLKRMHEAADPQEGLLTLVRSVCFGWRSPHVRKCRPSQAPPGDVKDWMTLSFGYCLGNLLWRRGLLTGPRLCVYPKARPFQTHVSEFRGCIQLAWWVVIKCRWRPSGPDCPSQPVKWGLACPPQSWPRRQPVWRETVYMCVYAHTHPCVCACPSLERWYCLGGCGSSLCIWGFSPLHSLRSVFLLVCFSSFCG